MSANTAADSPAEHSPESPADDTTPPEPGASAQLKSRAGLRRYITWYTLATIALTAVWGAAIGVLLPNQIQTLEIARIFTGADAGIDVQQLTLLQQSIDAETATATAEQARQLALLGDYNSARAQVLSTITSAGVVLTMLIQPLVGVASDRTRNRLGRRAPWILFGGLTGAILLVGVRYAPTVTVLAIVFVVMQAVVNTASGPLVASVADRVHESRRGTVSAFAGFGTFFGGLMGGVLAGALFAVVGLDFYLGIAAFLGLATVLFVTLARDGSSRGLSVPPFNWGEYLRGFTVALRAHDFRWVWIARILLTFGYTVSTALGLYMMQSYIRPALSAEQATATFPLLTLAGVPLTLVSVFVAGRLSDRVGKRRPFVIAASILMATSFLLPMLWPALPALFIQTVIAGIAFGIYLPVDQALFIDVLPDTRSAGRDLGVAALGSNLGQALGPALAGAVVAVTGGYLGIWVAATALVALAALAIVPVKGVR